MSNYLPDSWVILKINDELYKVLAGWSGGYLSGDSWKINSGIVKIEEHDEYYSIYGESGSIYECHKNIEHLRMSTFPIWKTIQKKLPSVEIVKIEDIKHKFII